jgi:reverse gyrase
MPPNGGTPRRPPALTTADTKLRDRSRRAKLSADELQQLADLGLEWAAA